ncbi:SDR family NAD(P)-dependent oxidoreductase [Achromobacter sp. DMS1]|uniref:SDR family NAD(P)-dependent oxidoreductase n=1 Tax=Achromobacter sp. DMS1 TaxID=1688405 RepID=UPI0009E7AC07|nr:SDR family NAD(P)-dependent oxidoreductase [Achromobacter sp. DMS1]
MDLGISGKTALVGGASKGLGYGCALALVREGVNVVIVARGAEALEAARQRLLRERPRSDGFVTAVTADITTPRGREAVFAAHRDYDIVVTNAGGPPPGDFRDWDRQDWLSAVEANMLTPIELIKATVDGMAERGFGRIVNITSSAVKAPIDILGYRAQRGAAGFGHARAGRERRPAAPARRELLPVDAPRPHQPAHAPRLRHAQDQPAAVFQRRVAPGRPAWRGEAAGDPS